MTEFKESINWNDQSIYSKNLSEEFIREFKDKVDWHYISRDQRLSEEFIREFKDYVDWNGVSAYQILSEDFIREFQNDVDWSLVSIKQSFSEEFIREFKDYVDWFWISESHKLSEGFIREFIDSVFGYGISKYQILSEAFIREFKNSVNWINISKYQKLSEEFRSEFNVKVPEGCWLYKTPEWKEKYIIENTKYIIEDGMVIAYKSCRSDGYSAYNFKYYYEVGKEYESTADYNQDVGGSFGLSAWTKEGALNYCADGKLFKVAIRPENIACVVHKDNKIRATKIKILELCN